MDFGRAVQYYQTSIIILPSLLDTNINDSTNQARSRISSSSIDNNRNNGEANLNWWSNEIHIDLCLYLRSIGWIYDEKSQLCCTSNLPGSSRNNGYKCCKIIGEDVYGKKIGYLESFDEMNTCRQGELLFVQDIMLIQRILKDPLLDRVSVVVITGFDSRSLYTDILISFLRKIVLKRNDLRVVIITRVEKNAEFLLGCFKKKGFPETSATILDCRDPSNGKSSNLGRYYYLPQPVRSFVNECIEICCDIHKNVPVESGNILMFLPDDDEIVQTCFSQLKDRLSNLHVIVFTSWKSVDIMESRIGCRNCILCTRMDVPRFKDIKYVIDSMFTKRTLFDCETGMESVKIMPISKEESLARAHFSNGMVIRVCTESSFQKLVTDLPPEIQRIDLAGAILQMKWLRVDDLAHFDYLSSPVPNGLIIGLDKLHALKAVDDGGLLTSTVGNQMAQFLPLDPMLSKLLLTSIDFGCSEEMVIIVSMLVVSNYKISSLCFHGKKLDDLIATFGTKQGDIIMLLNLYRFWKTGCGGGKNERNNFVKRYSIREGKLKRCDNLCKIFKKQLIAYSSSTITELQSCFQDVETIQTCITASWFLNAAKLLPDGKTYKFVINDQNAELHPSSVFHQNNRGGPPPPWIVVPKMQSRITLSCQTRVEWLFKFAPHVFSHPSMENQMNKKQRLLPQQAKATNEKLSDKKTKTATTFESFINNVEF